jgi:adenylate cyclase
MYNLACSMIKLGEVGEALNLLDPVFKAAQTQSLNWWKIDSDLDPIRNDARFKAMLERAEARLATSR